MSGLIHLDTATYIHFILVVIRVSSLFFVAPILSNKQIPSVIRLYLSLIVSLLLFSFLPPIHLNLQVSPIAYLFIIWKEIFIGLLIGGIARIVFIAIDVAGEVISFQMGLTIANVLDPTQGMQVSLISSFQTLFASLLFLLINGHYIIFEAIQKSYELFPIGQIVFRPQGLDKYVHLIGSIFVLALRFSAPLVIALLLANLIMGIMARSMPQMNVFIVGAPFMILFGLIMMSINVPYFFLVLKKELVQNMENIIKMIGYFRAT